MQEPSTPVIASDQTTVQTYRETMKSIEQVHRQGASGSQVLAKITAATDSLLVDLLSDKAQELGLDRTQLADQMCLVALGGYGRKEMHPHSDIDVMFLFPNKPDKEAENLVSKMLHALYDARLQIGNVTRDFAAAREIAREDLQSLTAMLEGRLIWGNLQQYETFFGQLSAIVRKNRKQLIAGKVRERQERIARYGNTINIQEPNLKDSPGSLRDYHHGIWLASFMRARKMNLAEMSRVGLILDREYRDLQKALEFSWRLRTELHLITGKKSDHVQMYLHQQLANQLGFQDEAGRLAEEILMREYFRTALAIQEFADRMSELATPKPFWRRVFHRVQVVDLGDSFRLRGGEIDIPRDLHFFENSPQRILDAFLHMIHTRASFSPFAITAIHENRNLIDADFVKEEESVGKIRMIFQYPGRIVPALRVMRRQGILHRLFPEWREIANLVRHDLHHRYTVDEHTLLALEYLETLEEDDLEFSAERLALWSTLDCRDLLRIAALYHDIGKGRGGDHCEIGAERVDRVAEILRLSEQDRADLHFLVLRHFMMSQTAQRHDMSDPDIVTGFAERVGTTRRLDLLYLLTYVDIKAVSPESMNEWKNHLLTQLYLSAHQVIEGKSLLKQKQKKTAKEVTSAPKELTRVFTEEEIRRQLSLPAQHDPHFYSKAMIREEIRHHLALLPKHYPHYYTTDMIRQHVDLIRRFDGITPVIHFCDQVHESTLEIVIIAKDRVGLFNRMTTAIALENFSIYSARLNTRDDGIVCNNIIVSDILGDGPVSDMRKDLLRERLQRLLVSTDPSPPIPPDRYGKKTGRTSFEPQVEVYEDAGNRHSVVDVCAIDRPGLLQDISSEISNMGMNIWFARVITEGSRAVDVFYVTDRDGKIISDSERRHELIDRIRSKL